MPSEDSDQPGHLPSLIRVFAVRMKKPWFLSYLLSTQRRLWSDWADAQADLSLLGAHSFCWFCYVVAHIHVEIESQPYVTYLLQLHSFDCWKGINGNIIRYMLGSWNGGLDKMCTECYVLQYRLINKICIMKKKTCIKFRGKHSVLTHSP